MRQKKTAPQSGGNGRCGGNDSINKPAISISATDTSCKSAAAVMTMATTADPAAPSYRTVVSLWLLARTAATLLAGSEAA